MAKFVSIEPHDLYVASDGFYRVVGVYLGAVGQESMVGLRALHLNHGTAHGETIKEMMVPMSFIVPQCVYRMVDHAPEAAGAA